MSEKTPRVKKKTSYAAVPITIPELEEERGVEAGHMPGSLRRTPSDERVLPGRMRKQVEASFSREPASYRKLLARARAAFCPRPRRIGGPIGAERGSEGAKI